MEEVKSSDWSFSFSASTESLLLLLLLPPSLSPAASSSMEVLERFGMGGILRSLLLLVPKDVADEDFFAVRSLTAAFGGGGESEKRDGEGVFDMDDDDEIGGSS